MFFFKNQFLDLVIFVSNYIHLVYLNNHVVSKAQMSQAVCCLVSDAHVQLEESTDMMKEMLSLLNNSNPDNQGSEVITAAVLDWLQGSPRTILLSPCVHAATRNLASLTCMAQIVELCIELAFVPGMCPFLLLLLNGQ